MSEESGLVSRAGSWSDARGRRQLHIRKIAMSSSVNTAMLAVWLAFHALADSLAADGPLSPILASAYRQGLVIGVVVLAAVGWSVWIFVRRKGLLPSSNSKCSATQASSAPVETLFDQLVKAHGLSNSDADLLLQAVRQSEADSNAEVFVNPAVLHHFASAQPGSADDCRRLVERLFGSAQAGVESKQNQTTEDARPAPSAPAGDLEQLADALAGI